MKKVVKNKFIIILSSLIYFVFINSAASDNAIVAIVGQLDGNVFVEDTNNALQKIKPYSQLTSGKTITVDSNSKAQIIYKKSGVAEVWGPGKFTIGVQGSEPIVGAPIEITEVPRILKRQISNMPKEVATFKRSGSVRVRSLPGMRLKEIDRVYKKLKEQQNLGEFYAELYWLNSLYNEKAFDKLKQAINDLKVEYNVDSGIMQLVEKYSG